MSYSVVRTGTLWFAVGFHIAFDYMQLFVIGTSNSAQVPRGRLLDVNFNGPSWLTGGMLGTEASFLMYPGDCVGLALHLVVLPAARKRTAIWRLMTTHSHSIVVPQYGSYDLRVHGVGCRLVRKTRLDSSPPRSLPARVFGSFPLNCRRRLPRNVVHHPGNPRDFVHDAA
jgi:hypothetical protein